VSDRLWIFLILILLGLPATAWASDKPYIQAYERVTFKWKGNYAHNSAKTFSRENKYLSGWSRNFMNGAPEEGHKVQKDGELRGLLFMPKAVSEPIPFIVLMHPCGGFKWHLNWVETTAAKFVEAGYGVIAPDSYTTRDIRMNCATDMGLHWGFRRGEDAYSALDYVIERKLAIPNKVYLVGYSNGGLATLVAMSNKMKAHPNKFAIGFALATYCGFAPIKSDTYYNPVVLVSGDADDLTPVRYCEELVRKKHDAPVQLFALKGANHGFMFDRAAGPGDKGVFYSYDARATKFTIETILQTIKTGSVAKGSITYH
jgi:dienelactone hydrolase